MDKFNEYLIIKGYSTKTVESIIKATNYFIRWWEADTTGDIAEAGHNDIIAYVKYCNDRGTGKKTVAQYIMHLKKYFTFLQEESQVSDNPCSNIKIKGIKRKLLYEILTLQELGNLYNGYTTEITVTGKEGYRPPQKLNTLSRKRNKVILGLLIWQGLRSEEVARLQMQDVKLREGKIFIAASKRTNERTLSLESHQVFELLDYINDTRKAILEHKKVTEPVQQLFVTTGTSGLLTNTLHMLLKHLHELNRKVKDLKQIRTSVITHWLKVHNLRKVQVMAGHRYVSSTESYKINNMEELKEDIKNYHPF